MADFVVDVFAVVVFVVVVLVEVFKVVVLVLEVLVCVVAAPLDFEVVGGCADVGDAGTAVEEELHPLSPQTGPPGGV